MKKQIRTWTIHQPSSSASLFVVSMATGGSDPELWWEEDFSEPSLSPDELDPFLLFSDKLKKVIILHITCNIMYK